MHAPTRFFVAEEGPNARFILVNYTCFSLRRWGLVPLLSAVSQRGLEPHDNMTKVF